MFEFQYTSSCLAADGKPHQHVGKGYFDSHDVLVSHLDHWSGQPAPGGGTYQYWESSEDRAANKAAKRLSKHHPYRLFSILHYGVQSRMNEFVSGEHLDRYLA
jgi:hypothetical protein